MATAVRLTVLTGPHKNQKFCFCGPTRCMLGRADDCFVQLCGTMRDQAISRHHCELTIDPPRVRMQDLGSLNGTFVNGRKMDELQRTAAACTSQEPTADDRGLPQADVALEQGDFVTVGGTTLRIDIVECPPPEMAALPAAIWKEGQTALRGCPVPCG